MAVTVEVLAVLSFTVVAFFGTASWALIRTLRQEDEKVSLLEGQARIDTYSPRALAELREWIENNPEDEGVERARTQYNDCVETLKESDRYYYDWTDSEVEALVRL